MSNTHQHMVKYAIKTYKITFPLWLLMSRDKPIADELEPAHWHCSLVQHGAQEGDLKDLPSNSSGKQRQLARLLHAPRVLFAVRVCSKRSAGRDWAEAGAALPGAAAATERSPCAGEARPRSPASQHQLLLRWPRPNFGVNVHREQSTGTVKNGCQGAHKGGQHDWQHQTPQTWNTKVGTGVSILCTASAPGTSCWSDPFHRPARSMSGTFMCLT